MVMGNNKCEDTVDITWGGTGLPSTYESEAMSKEIETDPTEFGIWYWITYNRGTMPDLKKFPLYRTHKMMYPSSN